MTPPPDTPAGARLNETPSGLTVHEVGKQVAAAYQSGVADGKRNALAAHDAPGLAEAALREAVETQAAVWSAPESHRNGAWLRERDAADILRALLAAHSPTAPEEAKVHAAVLTRAGYGLVSEAQAERDRLRAAVERVEALAWFGDEDEEVAHVAACQDFGCKTCVVIACASDLRAALDGAGQ